MKNLIITLLLICGMSTLKAQPTPKFKALEIGEKVPDFEFAIQNYHSPTAKLSDFRGKLVMLDFWSTGCVTCFAGFPWMARLQEQYGDQIQVILVNVRETEKEVNERIIKKKESSKYLTHFPSIIGNASFFELFPHRFAGHFVWIDKEGILRLSSAMDVNIYDEKINDVLNGKPITFARIAESYTQKEQEKSLMSIIENTSVNNLELGSIFTPMNLDYFPAGGQLLGRIDSASNTIRSTYVNRTVLQLYAFAQVEEVTKEWKSKVYGPNLGLDYLDPFQIFVKDSMRYANHLFPYRDWTDLNMGKSMYCYEQVLPLGISKEQQAAYMREDLDRYFELKYGARVTVEEVMLPCYLIRKINEDPLSEKEIKVKLKRFGKRDYLSTENLGVFVSRFFRNLGFELPYVFDLDGEDRKRKFLMPTWKKGDRIEDFQEAMRLNGLEFEKGEHKIKMMVVRETL